MPKRFAGLTENQQRVFAAIAAGNSSGHNERTLAVLENHGMIQRVGDGWRIPKVWRMQYAMWVARQQEDSDSSASNRRGRAG